MNYTGVLITNLRYVCIGAVRTNTHALLLEHEQDPLNSSEMRSRIRGFGTQATWPVFDMLVPSIEFEHAEPEDFGLIVGAAGAKPLITRSVLCLKDGPELLLILDDCMRPINVERFQFDDEKEIDRINDIWHTLACRVAEHWHAPNMPTLIWRPPFVVTAIQKEGHRRRKGE